MAVVLKCVAAALACVAAAPERGAAGHQFLAVVLKCVVVALACAAVVLKYVVGSLEFVAVAREIVVVAQAYEAVVLKCVAVAETVGAVLVEKPFPSFARCGDTSHLSGVNTPVRCDRSRDRVLARRVLLLPLQDAPQFFPAHAKERDGG